MPKSNHVETISQTIREQILAGAFKPYDVLPTRKALADQFHTTPDTIAKVIALLQSEGLVFAKEGRTIYVNTPRERITTTEETFRDYMKAQGFEVVQENLGEPHLIPMDPEVAKAFQMPVGTSVVARVRREIVDGIPYRYSMKYYAAPLVDKQALQGMQQDETFNFRAILAEEKPIVWMHEEIIARAVLTAEEMDILHVSRGTPVLQLTQINYAADGSRVLYAKVVFIGAYFVKAFDYAPEEEPKLRPFPYMKEEEINQ